MQTCDTCSNLSHFLLHSKALNKVFVYNHKQSEWRELAAMKTARAMFGTVVHGGKIIAVGGVNEEGLSNMCETYDFAANKYVRPFSLNVRGEKRLKKTRPQQILRQINLYWSKDRFWLFFGAYFKKTNKCLRLLIFGGQC